MTKNIHVSMYFFQNGVFARVQFSNIKVLESMDLEEHTERLARRAWALSAMDDEQRRRGSQEVISILCQTRLTCSSGWVWPKRLRTRQ